VLAGLISGTGQGSTSGWGEKLGQSEFRHVHYSTNSCNLHTAQQPNLNATWHGLPSKSNGFFRGPCTTFLL